MDETRLDPKTPAHIFAYKALRGIFIASPESSPIRPPPQQLFDHDDKENTPSPRRGSHFTTSPTKTKRKDTDFDIVKEAISLTPKRQKIVQVSPVKSCLKKTGMTPRREATVTFKDLRISISPELARQVQVQQPDFSVVKVSAETEAVIPVRKTAVKERPVSKSSEVAKKSDTVITVYNEVLEAYKTQMEKEVRRLIKYGQKWKDQAKKQETRNEELQAMIEELQRENQILNRKLAQKEEIEKLARQSTVVEPRRKSAEPFRDPRETKRDLEPSRRSFQVRPVELDETLNLEAKVEKAYGPNLGLRQSSVVSSRDIRQTAREEVSEDELPISASPPIRARASEVQSRSAGSSRSARVGTSNVQSVSLTKTPSTIRADLPVRSASNPTIHDEKEERRAAARARLAARRAGRLASAPVLSTTPRSSKQPGSKTIEGEESQVDWAGL